MDFGSFENNLRFTKRLFIFCFFLLQTPINVDQLNHQTVEAVKNSHFPHLDLNDNTGVEVEILLTNTNQVF